MADPNGVDLCSGTTDGDTLPNWTTYEEREITFDTPYELTSGGEYAIVIRALNADDFESVFWVLGGNDYANGTAKYSSDSGDSWDDESGDAWFKTKAGAAEKNTNTPTGIDSVQDVYNVNWAAQTFVASSTYTISSVVLKLAKWSGSTPGTITVSIQSTLPKKPINPTPEHEASNVGLNATTVTWEDGGGAESYNVYYGTLSGFLTLLEEGVTDTEYTLITGAWPYYDNIFYWRVDAVNANGTTQGDEWNFTTLVFDPVLPTGVTLDEDGNPTGTPTGENNIITVKRLVAAANNRIWYET